MTSRPTRPTSPRSATPTARTRRPSTRAAAAAAAVAEPEAAGGSVEVSAPDQFAAAIEVVEQADTEATEDGTIEGAAIEDGEEAEAAEQPAEPTMPANRFLDRELSWLAFNERVLALAQDESLPLLERARFLAIFASNLDEFFMVRVAGLKRRIATGLAVTAASGMEPRQVLEAISEKAHELQARHADIYRKEVAPALAEAGITLVHWNELSEVEQEKLHGFFRDQVFPVLTPLAVDPAHPFPYISGLSLNLAVILRNPFTDKEHFARVKVPPLLPRFIKVGGDHDHVERFAPLEDVIAVHLDQLFSGMEVLQQHTFRVTRNEDLEVEEDDAETLLQALEKELLRRRFGPPVRLELAEDVDDHVRDLLIRELGVSQAEVYYVPEPLDLRGLNAVADLDVPELRYPKFVPK